MTATCTLQAGTAIQLSLSSTVSWTSQTYTSAKHAQTALHSSMSLQQAQTAVGDAANQPLTLDTTNRPQPLEARKPLKPANKPEAWEVNPDRLLEARPDGKAVGT